MKKIYILFFMILQAGISLAQDFDSFQFRLVAPGSSDGTGIFRVQMRALLPTDLPTPADVCSQLGWKIWWNHNTTDIEDITMASTIFGPTSNFTIEDPIDENNGGTPGKVVKISLSVQANFVSNWEVNKWEQIATFNICSNPNCSPAGAPPGMTAANFLIQGFDGEFPFMEMNADGNYYIPLNNGPLPLDLIAFHAQKSGERNAHLTWITANEENTSHFIVQRSFDKNTWTDVGTVGAAGNSIDIRNYELTDLEVSNGRSSTVRAYYRLKMVDLDGRTKFSPIESVIFSGSTTADKLNAFEVFPNPAAEGLYVTWDKQENLDQPSLLELYDITGKLVYRQVVSDQTTQEYIDLAAANVQSGVYMLRILNGSTPLDHKQVVVGQNR